MTEKTKNIHVSLGNPFEPTVYRSVVNYNTDDNYGTDPPGLPSPFPFRSKLSLSSWGESCFNPPPLPKWQQNGLSWPEWQQLIKDGLKFPPLLRQVGHWKVKLMSA